MGRLDIENILSNISAREAKEWELFNLENPIPEEQIIIQLAMIAQVFASYFIKRKDKKGWKLNDFIPNFKIEGNNKNAKNVKNVAKNLQNQLFDMVDTVGDKKAKKWAKKRMQKPIKKSVKSQMVKGTDGKMYKYALEEFAKKRSTVPKRLKKRGM